MENNSFNNERPLVSNLGGVAKGLPTTPNVGLPSVDRGGLSSGAGGNISLDEAFNSAYGRIKGNKMEAIPYSSIYKGNRYDYTFPGADYEEMHAQQQGILSKGFNGITKGVGLVGTTIAGGFGMLYGAGKFATGGQFSDIWDNPIMHSLDTINKQMEDALPNYYTQQETNAEWWQKDNLFTANFIFDKLIKNSGYAVGAMFSGNIANSALSASGKAIGRGFAGLANQAHNSQTFKMLTPLLRGSARAFSAGENAKAFEVLSKQIDSISDLSKKTKDLSSIAKSSNKFAAFNDAARRTAIATYSSTGEASFEALQTSLAYKEAMIQKFIEENGYEPSEAMIAQFEQQARIVGNTAFLGNMAVLTATEFNQLPYLLGSSYKNSRNVANNFFNKTDDVLIKDGKYMVAPGPSSKFGKLYQKVKPVGQFLFDPKESFQEMSQYAIQVGTQNYFAKAFNSNDADIWADGFMYGFTGVDEKGEGVGALVSKEGLEGALIGGITGGVMQGLGKRFESKAIAANTAKFVEELNNVPSIKAAFIDKLSSVNRGVVLQQEQEQAILAGEELEAKDLNADLMHNYLATRIKYGRFDMVMEDLNELKQMGLTDEGLDVLKGQGIGTVSDTVVSFQDRLSKLEESAKNINNLYEAFNTNYGGLLNVDKDGQVVLDDSGNPTKMFSPEAIDRMVYAAHKISNYDKRILELGSELSSKGINSQLVLTEALTEADSNIIEEELARLSSIEAINNSSLIDRDILEKDMVDLVELGMRRKKFLDEFNSYKMFPSQVKTEQTYKTPVEETEDTEPKETIKVKTKLGERELEIGTEYFLGKVVEYSKEGKEVYRIPKLTILGQNEDGTIKIKTSNGNIKDVKASELEDYKLAKVSYTLNNKVAKYYMEHMNTVFEHYGIKVKGKPVKGRLEFEQTEDDKKDNIYFVYVKNSKVKRQLIDGTYVVPKKGYKHGLLKAIGDLTPVQIKSSKDFEKFKDEAVQNKLARRLAMLEEMYEEAVEKHEASEKLLEQKRNQLNTIIEQHSKLKENLSKPENIDNRFKNFNFKKQARTSLKTLMTLSKMKEDLENEITELEVSLDDTKNVIEELKSLKENIHELPTGTKDLLNKIGDEIVDLEILAEKTIDQIGAVNSLIKATTNAIKATVNYLQSLISKFESKYPNMPRVIGQEWIDYIQNSPLFKMDPALTEEWSATYKQELFKMDEMLTLVEEEEIKPNEERLDNLNEHLQILESSLNDVDKALRAKQAIYNKLKLAYDNVMLQKEQEANMRKKESLQKEFLGINTTDVQTNNTTKVYEPIAKKTAVNVVSSTRGVEDDSKANNARANRFGNRFNSFSENEKEEIKGIVVTSKTEHLVGLPGLAEEIVRGSSANKDDVIALVMVKAVGDSYALVNEFGEILTKEELLNPLNHTIYQVFPSEKLEGRYDGKTSSMFRDNTPDYVKEGLTEQYREWRKSTLALEELSPASNISASFGIPEYVKKWNDTKKIFEIDYDSTTPVTQTGLLPESKLSTEPVLIVSTNNKFVSNGTVTFATELGRVFLKVPNGLIKLNNRKFNQEEASVIYQSILQLSKIAFEEGTLKGNSNAIEIINWLRSVSYWGIAKDATTGERKPGGYNNIWFEEVRENNKPVTKLFISGLGKSIYFSPREIESNKEEMLMLFTNMYNNVNASLINDAWNNAYTQILGYDKNGNPITKQWKNYQTYLLSSEGRTEKQIPLTTNVAPVKESGLPNNKGIYFIVEEQTEFFEIPTAPKVVQPAAPVVPVQPTPQPPTETKVTPVVDSGDLLAEDSINIDGKQSVTYKLNITKVGNYLKTLGGPDYLNENLNEFIDAIVKAGFYTVNIPEGLIDVIRQQQKAQGRDIEHDLDVIAFTQAVTMLKHLNQIIAATVPQEAPVTPTPVATPVSETVEETVEETQTETVEETKPRTGIRNGGLASRVGTATSPDDTVYREEIVKKAKQFKTEDWNKLETWFAKNFPHLPVYRVKNIIKATNGKQAWGMLHQGAIYVYENAEIGTAYHEVFEAVWKMFALKEEITAVEKDFRNRKGSYIDPFTGKEVKYSKATADEMREKLAEEFRDYVLNDKLGIENDKKSLLGKLFSQLIDFIKSFFVGENAATNTEELFKKIGSGYYAKFNPYETKLSYASQGIINIEDASPNSDSVFRLENIPFVQLNEILQEMTYKTISEMISTNEDLFNVSQKLNSTDLYTRLKEHILNNLGYVATELTAAFESKQITEEEYNNEYNNIDYLFENIENEWEEIKAKHKEFLYSYGIEFDENDEINFNEVEKSKEDPYGNVVNVDNFRKLGAATRLVMGTLIKTRMVEGKLKPVRSTSTGGVELIPVENVYVELLNTLYDSVDINDMLLKLKKLATDNINYRALYSRITKNVIGAAKVNMITSEEENNSGIDYSKMNESDFRLLSAFWRGFKKTNPEVAIVYIMPTGEVIVGESNLAIPSLQFKKEFSTALVQTIKDDKNPYIEFDNKKLTYSAKVNKSTGNKVADEVILDPSDLNSYIKFLNKIGIDFTLAEIKKIKNPQHKQQFINSVNGLRLSLSKLSEVGLLSSKTLDVDGTTRQLGVIKALLESPTTEATFFNINGERTQAFIGTNTLSTLYDVISKAKSLNDLASTNYKYLLPGGDAFAQGSVVIKKMFNTTGNLERISGTESILKPAWIDGTLNEETGKKKQSSKLTLKERFVQEINLNLKGIYSNLVPGDAALEQSIRLHNEDSPFVTESSYVNDGYFDIFKDYFIAEVNLSRDDKRILKLSKGRNAKDLRFFKSILGDSLHTSIIGKNNDGKTAEEIYEENKEAIENAVKQYIKNEAKETEQILKNLGVISYGDSGLEVKNISSFENEEVITQEIVDRKMGALTINYVIANIELHKILFSDPYQYSDELKRIKNFLSPRQPMMFGDVALSAALHNKYNSNFKEKEIGYTDFNRQHFNAATIGDVISDYELDKYDFFEETDGGGYISEIANRIFKILTGTWTPANERQFIHDMGYIKLVKSGASKEEIEKYEKNNPGVKDTYTPTKPIVSGGKNNGRNYNDVVMHKFALVPLSFRLLHKMDPNSNAIKLLEKMNNENVDYVVYETGAKVGAEKVTPLYNKDGSFTKTPFTNKEEQANPNVKQGVSKIPFSIMSVQAEVPSKDTPKVTQGSQVTKLATLDYLEAGVPIDFKPDLSFEERFTEWVGLSMNDQLNYNNGDNLYKEIVKNQALLEERIKEGYKTVLNDFGITETNDGYEITDKAKLAEMLESEVLKREVNENMTDIFKDFRDNSVVLEATPAYQQIRNIIYSIADKELVSKKISGGMKVQVPSTLFENTRAEAKVIKNSKGEDTLVYKSDILQFYSKKEGSKKINVCEIMVGRWFESDMSDDDLMHYFNNTPEGQKELAALNGVAFRIPTQKQNSIDVFKIAKFLPKEYGDSVVIPSALVKKAGSDFDIDKLSIYLKNMYKSANGLPKVVPYYGIGQQAIDKFKKLLTADTLQEASTLSRKIIGNNNVLDTIDNIIAGNASEETVSKWVPLLRQWFPEFIENDILDVDGVKKVLNDRIRKAGKKLDGLKLEELESILLDELAYKMYKQSLDNAYIESLENLISHELNFDRLVEPNSAEILKTLSKNINKEMGIPEIDYTETGNMLKRGFMTSLRQAFVSGKYAIGIAAVAQTNHAQNQREAIYVDLDKKQGLNDRDVVILGHDSNSKTFSDNPNVNFEEYNSIFVDGKNRPTLSKIKNAAGEFISDIIGMFIDGYVDISKGPWIMELGATPNVAGTWLFLLKIGVPTETVAYFMNQPIIRDYLKSLENSGYSYIFNQSLIENMLEVYEPSANFDKTGTSITSIPTKSELKKLLKYNIEENKRDMSDVDLSTQQYMLKEFIKYAKMGEHLFLVTQGSNYDTATFNDPLLLLKKQKQYEKAQNTIISSVDKSLESTFVGMLKYYLEKTRNGLAEVLVSDSNKNASGGMSMRAVLEEVLTPHVGLSDRDFVKFARKAVNDLFDWAMQTKGDKLGKNVKAVLLGTSTQESAAKQIFNFKQEVMNNPEHPLYGNYILESLQFEGNGKTIPSTIKLKNNVTYNVSEVNYGLLISLQYTKPETLKILKSLTPKPDNISIKGRDNKVYDQNRIIYSFRELREKLSAKDRHIYSKLIALTVLQSGLSRSGISFTSLLPYEDFKEAYGKVLSVVADLPGLDEFLNTNSFERNNWNNEDIVPQYYAKWVTKDFNPTIGNSHPDAVKLQTAYHKGEVPFTATIGIFSREANSDFVTITWDNRTMTPTEKALARKKGDYSYINKGLFKKVYELKDGKRVPVIFESPNKKKPGQTYKNYLYKMVNALGDSYRAQEFYEAETVNGTTLPASVIDNGYTKVKEYYNLDGTKALSKEVEDEVILDILGKNSVSLSDTILLKDGIRYSKDVINSELLLNLGYSEVQIGDILNKLIC